jgi:hypothetical protein
MSEMVERVARIVFDILAADPDWDDAYETREQAAACGNDDTSQEECREYARRIIAAMREPTEAMIEASNREWDGRMSARSAGVWQAMIDAALAPMGLLPWSAKRAYR